MRYRTHINAYLEYYVAKKMIVSCILLSIKFNRIKQAEMLVNQEISSIEFL